MAAAASLHLPRLLLRCLRDTNRTKPAQISVPVCEAACSCACVCVLAHLVWSSWRCDNREAACYIGRTWKCSLHSPPEAAGGQTPAWTHTNTHMWAEVWTEAHFRGRSEAHAEHSNAVWRHFLCRGKSYFIVFLLCLCLLLYFAAGKYVLGTRVHILLRILPREHFWVSNS